MGVTRGVTLLTGGGFHGKSTLLEAIQVGVYNHIFNDGREWTVTEPSAVKIRAEDGRSIVNVDIRPFISGLPGQRDTSRFCTDDASGSTSMAANIQESLELGAKALLIDEDTSATNLLVRDERMQQLISNEPITPFISHARQLFEQAGVSTILVVGGLGDWLSVADNVIGMDEYRPHLLTKEARELARRSPAKIPPRPRNPVDGSEYVLMPGTSNRDCLQIPVALGHGKGCMSRRMDTITTESFELDLRAIEQLVEHGQTRTIAHLITHFAASQSQNGRLRSLCEQYEGDRLFTWDKADKRKLGDLVGLRSIELGAAINRIRGLHGR